MLTTMEGGLVLPELLTLTLLLFFSSPDSTLLETLS